jgi:hypothetical protein
VILFKLVYLEWASVVLFVWDELICVNELICFVRKISLNKFEKERKEKEKIEKDIRKRKK